MRRILPAAVLSLGLALGACGASVPTSSDVNSAATEVANAAATAGITETDVADAMATAGVTETGMADAMATAEAAAGSVTETDVADAMATAEAAAGSVTETDVADAMNTASAVGGTILEAAAADGRFTTLATALSATGLDKTLSEAGPYTIFAPTDEAFAKLPASTLQQLLVDPATLEKVLTYHVVSGNLAAKDVAAQTTLKTLEGQDVAVSSSGSMVKLNNSATVTSTDLQGSNGVIHVIDTVLIPSDVQLPQ